MGMHVRTEGDKSVFSSAKFETFAITLFKSKPHIIIIFHLKTNRQKLEKYHVNGSQTRIPILQEYIGKSVKTMKIIASILHYLEKIASV